MKWNDRIGRRLKLHDLHVLMTVAESGTMGRAAERLAVSPPSVSKAISDMEHAIGVRLLDRTAKGVEPTAYGRALLQHSVGAFEELRQAIKNREFVRSFCRRGQNRLSRCVHQRPRLRNPRPFFQAVPARDRQCHGCQQRSGRISPVARSCRRSCHRGVSEATRGRRFGSGIPLRGPAVHRHGARQPFGTSSQGKARRPGRGAMAPAARGHIR